MKPKVGLLPLYIELYDQVAPEKRAEFDGLLEGITNAIRQRGVEVINVPVCRLKVEFEKAVADFEKASVDAIVTLHLAYSPSLESAEVLAKTKLPVLILDTTRVYDFGPEQSPDEIMYNHGIHGVQDLCNLLIRNNKAYHIEAGHWQKSDVIDRIASWAHAAMLCSRMKNARVGKIGKPFPGMADFAVPAEVLKSTIGMDVVQCSSDTIGALIPDKEDKSVKEEINKDRDNYLLDNIDPLVHSRTIQVCLAVRRWIEKEKLTAFTMNFLDVSKQNGFMTVPFLEASKAMGRGIGYAGEGDVLTAALTGALLSVYPETTFTEMFCPDWKGNSIFLNHMGEMNINLAAGKAKLIEMDYHFSDTDNPIIAVGRFKEGKVVLVNLAPGRDGTFTLVICPADMIAASGEDRFGNSVHGWFKPAIPIQEFLPLYSNVGGTHHSVMVYGEVADEMRKFGTLMGWRVVTIG